MINMKKYTYNECYESSLEYFKGDQFAAGAFAGKYALVDNEGNYDELNPHDMHHREAKEFARIESKYTNPVSEENIFDSLKWFKYIVPQGSPMTGIGNPYRLMSLSNCFLAGTQVLTINDGIKNIENIKVGDLVPTHNGNVKPVIQIHKNKLNGRRVFDIKCFRTPRIKVTENHEFWSITKEQLGWGESPQWNTIDKLRKGDLIAIPNVDFTTTKYNIDIYDLLLDFDSVKKNVRYRVSKDENNIFVKSEWDFITLSKKNIIKSKDHNTINRYWEVNEDFSFFLGLWYCDGCVFSENKKGNLRGITFTFGSHENKLIDFVSTFGEKIFGIKADINNNKLIDGSTQIVFNSAAIAFVFVKLFGRGCNGKTLPSFIYSWSRNLVDKLLAGLIYSDGTVTKNGDVRVVLNNVILVKQFYFLARLNNHIIGFSVISNNKNARLDFPKGSPLLNFIKKHYNDDRINIFIKKEESQIFTRKINNIKFVEIHDKKVFNCDEEYVYTFGVEDDHSYCVEGVICKNCFVTQKPFDSYAGIIFTDQEMAQIYKRRGGVGTDISSIRPKGLATNNAAKTTDGIAVFMDRFSNTCREVAMQGRRGALMLTINVHHPEIETFITIKQDKTRVTGANISIFFTDEFMNAVKNDEEYEQRWPVDSKTPSITKKVKAKEVWDKFIYSTWASAEPGALFESTIRKMTPSDIYKDEGFGTVSTNPCFHGDEYILLKNGYVKFKDSLEKDLGEPLTDNRISYIDDGKEESPEKWKIDLSKIGVTQQPYNGSAFVTKEFSELLELEFSNGQTLKCTPDHHIATTVGMVEAKDLTNNHEILVAKPEKVEFKLPETEEELKYYLFGAILSCNGISCKNTDNCISLSYNNEKILKENNIDYKVAEKEEIIQSCDFDTLQMKFESNKKTVFEIKYTDFNYISIEHILNNCNTKIGRNFILGMFNGDIISDEFDYYKINYNNKFDIKTFNKIKLIFSANGLFKSNNTKLISKKEIEGDTVYCIKEPNTRSIIVNSISTRRCGEIVLSPYDSCRLMALNLYSFVENKFKEDAYFDFDKFIEKVRLAQRMMDDLIDLEIEAVDKIIAKVESDPEPANIKAIELDLWNKIKNACIKGRRTGLGITALGDTIAALGLRYGDEKSIEVTEKIYKYLTCSSYYESIQLAKERGHFSVWSYEKEKGHPFIERIMEGVVEMFGQEAYEDYKTYGRRNIANTTTAPTGTVSTQTQTTSGIEPAFMLKYNRKKKVNPGDNNVKVDFVDNMGDSWQTFTVYHHGFKEWMDVTGKTEIEQSPYYKATSNDVDWLASVDIQASAQKYIDHSISKTCNLPKDTSKELISDIYMRAWEKGCKGFTVYREGCRDGVLTSVEAEDKEKRSALKRPSKLVSETTKIKLDTGDGVKNAYITVSFFPDTKKPYEVFVNAPVGQNVKDLQIAELSSRMTSLALRHGVNVDFVVDQLSKIDGQYIYSIPVGLAKALRPYISNDEQLDLVEEEVIVEDDNSDVRTSKCPSCGNKSFIIEEGCGKCLDCMYSKCS